jgi:hypothetical protein
MWFAITTGHLESFSGDTTSRHGARQNVVSYSEMAATFNSSSRMRLASSVTLPFALALNRKLQQRGDDIVAIFFTPGLIPQSGLFRNEGAFRFMFF